VDTVSADFEMGSPHPALRGAVIRYAGFAERSPVPVTFRELPCTYTPVIIDLDAGWSVSDGRTTAAPVKLGSFVAGLTDGPVLVGHDGSANCLQVDLTPLAARRLLGVPMSELANRSVPIDDVLGRAGRELVQRVGDTPHWPARFALVDSAIRVRLDDAPPVDDGVAWAFGQLVASGGKAVIGDLAGELGWSHRRLIARFRDVIGLPPKLVARIVRFERLTSLVTADPRIDWTCAAATCGYFDQAHLAREVRDLAGVTPTGLRDLSVNSVQDDAAPRA
jgi:AraC-like DNA-binding protein